MPAKSLFPAVTVKEARALSDAIAHNNAGQPMRRLDVFEVLGKSPDSGPSRVLVTGASSYGLTVGGYQAEMLSLASLGQRLSVEGDDTALIDAVLNIDIFKTFFEKYKGGSVPAEVAGKSFLASSGIPTDRVQACWEMLLENGRLSGLIDMLSGGGERVLSREHAIERKFGKGPQTNATGAAAATKPDTKVGPEADSAGHATITKLQAGMPSLNINLEIHLPADTRPEVYDAIFGSMRKHLIDAE